MRRGDLAADATSRTTPLPERPVDDGHGDASAGHEQAIEEEQAEQDRMLDVISHNLRHVEEKGRLIGGAVEEDHTRLHRVSEDVSHGVALLISR